MLLLCQSDTDLLSKAQSPRLATAHYIYYVALVPLIMMNLLIARELQPDIPSAIDVH